MTMNSAAGNTLLRAGLTKAEYDSLKPALNRRNGHTLFLFSSIGAVMLQVLFIASFFVEVLAVSRWLYLGTFFALLTLAFLSNLLIPTHPHWTLPLFYAFLAICYAFSITLGLLPKPHTVATTFPVLLVALPLIILDRPVRTDALLIAATAVFCATSYLNKEPHLAEYDVVNALSFLLLGIVLNYYVVKTKLRESLLRRYTEKERDTDALSHLLTKTAFQRELQEQMKAPNYTGTMVFLDIDNFKTANDTRGHAFGDFVLQVIGDCIRESFRPDDLFSRFGGDEFVLFLPGLCQQEIVADRLENLIALLHRRLTLPEAGICITASLGAAMYPQDAATYEALLEHADAALYDAKHAGKNCYCFYRGADAEG